MTIQPTLSGRAIAGAVFVTLGIFIFYENLYQAVAQMRYLAGDIPSDALGIVPTIILAAARVLQVYAADHQRFLQIVLEHTLVLGCPLLLVMAGTVLSRDAFVGDINALSKKTLELSI